MDTRAAVLDCLPEDEALLLGRAYLADGPCVIALRGGNVYDVTRHFPTVSELLNLPDPATALLEALPARPAASLSALLDNSACLDGGGAPVLLAPCDLQAIKACGVTFPASLMERLIEEGAGGDPGRAATLRSELLDGVGAELRDVRPGSAAAARLKTALQARGMWSQYLEVAIGPDAEVFTKAQPLAAVGHGMEIGVHPGSQWNNPEPEVVLAVNCHGRIVGATLGNDVNLRDMEGRSALLLGRAKDNNGACAIGPFIRLFDGGRGGGFTLDALRDCTVSLRVRGADGFEMRAQSHMAGISRAPEDLVRQTIDGHHDFPDGLMLFLGTMFVPTADRDGTGLGFTHKLGDIVEIGAPCLGRLVNRVNRTDRVHRRDPGIAGLMHNLAARGLLGPRAARPPH
jgi:fumarylacetoacetate (FAA) hydrolase family protein